MCIALFAFSIGSVLASVAYKPPTETNCGFNASKTIDYEYHQLAVVNYDFLNQYAIAFPTHTLYFGEVKTVPFVFGKSTLSTATEFYLFRLGYIRDSDEKLPDIYKHIKHEKLYILNCQLAFK